MTAASTAASPSATCENLEVELWTVGSDGLMPNAATVVALDHSSVALRVRFDIPPMLAQLDQAHIVAFGPERLPVAAERDPQPSVEPGTIRLRFLSPAEVHDSWLGEWMDLGQ